MIVRRYALCLRRHPGMPKIFPARAMRIRLSAQIPGNRIKASDTVPYAVPYSDLFATYR